MRGRPVSQVEVEAELLDRGEHLEALTTGGVSPLFPDDPPFEGYDDLCEAAAEAEADWKIQEASSIVSLANKPREEGTRAEPEYLRKARVLALHHEKYRHYKRTGAERDARKEALTTTRDRMDALRTVAANQRTQT